MTDRHEDGYNPPGLRCNSRKLPRSERTHKQGRNKRVNRIGFQKPSTRLPSADGAPKKTTDDLKHVPSVSLRLAKNIEK